MARPFLPKPRLQWKAEIGGNESLRISQRISRTRPAKRFIRQEGRMAVFSRQKESIFLLFPFGFPESPKNLLSEFYRILPPEGKIAIGFVPRQSPWAKCYLEKLKGSSCDRPETRFHSVEKMERMMMNAGFSLQGIISTLFQRPGNVRRDEKPMRGYRSQAGFLILQGERPVWTR